VAEFTKTVRWSDSCSYRAFGKGPTIQSILVLKVDHIGDFMLGLEALVCLRRAFQNAIVDIACGPWNVELADSTGLFNNVYPVAFFGARADGAKPPFDPAVVAHLHGKNWDLVIDLRIDPDTRVLLRYIEGRWKIGFESAEHNEIMTICLPGYGLGNLPNIGINQKLQMLQLIHAVIDAFWRPNDVRELLLTRVAAPIFDLSVPPGRPLVVCNTSSGRLVKNWPLERFKRLITWLATDLECSVVLLGDEAQATDAAEILAFCSSTNIISAVGRTSVREAMRIIASATIYIGNDTGLSHVASLLGVRSVILFSGVDSIERFAPIGTNTTILASPVSCAPCYITQLRDCVGGQACVLNISESMVRSAVLSHLFAAPTYDYNETSASVHSATAPSSRHEQGHALSYSWIRTHQSEIPQRYSQNLHRYLAQRDRLDLQELLRVYTKGNENNLSDMNRFYTFTLVFDQIMKEQINGDLAELGVKKGNTGYLLASLARRIGATAYLFDTFDGLTAGDLHGIDADKRMEFTDISLDAVKALVGFPSVQYIQGYFPNTVGQISPDTKFCLVHIDCDLYAPFKAALEYFYPRIVPGGFMVLHDYGSLHWKGVARAIDEFFSTKPESVVPVPDGGGTVVVRKLKAADEKRNWLVQTKDTGFANAWVIASCHPIDTFLSCGWSVPESWGTWGIGNRHIISLLVLNPRTTIELAVESQLALLRGREQGWVDVYIGSKHYARWNYSFEHNRGVRSLRFSRDVMIEREDGLFGLEIEFRPSSCTPPRDIDPSSSETRPLGLGLFRFRQRPLDGADLL
jgi:ADP-heptose:LPS heptosyltransferase